MLRDLSFVRGWPDTVATLRAWRRRPLQVVGPWILLSAAIALLLLALTWLVGERVAPDPQVPRSLPHDIRRDELGAARHVFANNLVVLALHALACFAGYVTHLARTDPSGPEGEDGRLDRLTHRVGLLALVFVPAATLFSIGTQAWVLGSHASTLGLHLRIEVDSLMRSVLPHAVPELTAIFLPLAAWLVTSRRRAWEELIAATLVSTAIAIPVIGLAALVEARTWPDRVDQVQTRAPVLDGVRLGYFSASDREGRPGVGTAIVGSLAPGGEVRTLALAHAFAARYTRARGSVAIFARGNGFVVHDLYMTDYTLICDRANRSLHERRAQSMRLPLDPGFVPTMRLFTGDLGRDVGLRAVAGGARIAGIDVLDPPGSRPQTRFRCGNASISFGS